jgi:hypothetical protein
MESFFDHMKNNIILKTLNEIKKEISRYMNYYNSYKHHQNLKEDDPCSIQRSSSFIFLIIPFLSVLDKGYSLTTFSSYYFINYIYIKNNFNN